MNNMDRKVNGRLNQNGRHKITLTNGRSSSDLRNEHLRRLHDLTGSR